MTTQTHRVLKAVNEGYQDAASISKRARVPILHVHPLLNRLRERKEIKGFTGCLKMTKKGLHKLQS